MSTNEPGRRGLAGGSAGKGAETCFTGGADAAAAAATGGGAWPRAAAKNAR